MYIPKEVIWYSLGFISSPLIIYGLYEFWLKKKEAKSDKGSNKPTI